MKRYFNKFLLLVDKRIKIFYNINKGKAVKDVYKKLGSIVIWVISLVAMIFLAKSFIDQDGSLNQQTLFTQYAGILSQGQAIENKISFGEAIVVESGQTYTLSSSQTLSGYDGQCGGAVYVQSGGEFILDGGEISNNRAQYGGAIYVENGARCIINSGKIAGNHAEEGYAIYVENGGTLEITSVTFSNNIKKEYDESFQTYVVEEYRENEEGLFILNKQEFRLAQAGTIITQNSYKLEGFELDVSKSVLIGEVVVGERLVIKIYFKQVK